MSANTNPPRNPVMAKCQENDPRRAGAIWDINGEDRRMGTQRTWLLQPFLHKGRDENGRATRSAGRLTEEQAAMFTKLYGIEFEQSSNHPDVWHPLMRFDFKNWYSMT